MTSFTESVVEDAALAWLKGLGYVVLHGPEIAVGMPAAERTDPTYHDVILESRLRQSLVRLKGEKGYSLDFAKWNYNVNKVESLMRAHNPAEEIEAYLALEMH